jgi:hypothetical protein
MATNAEKLEAVRQFAARELLYILTRDYAAGSSPFNDPLVAQYVAVAQAADIAKEALHQFEEPVAPPPDLVERNDFDPRSS